VGVGPRRGDQCPSFCGGEHWELRVDVLGRARHGAAGVVHYSPPLDAWRLSLEGAILDRSDCINVRIEGFRHDDVDNDWPDLVVVEARTGSVVSGGVNLEALDARRLAAALVAAADLIDRG
jgi:hypothetical protein